MSCDTRGTLCSLQGVACGGSGSDEGSDGDDCISTVSGVSVASSYLYSEQGQSEVRRLVHQSLMKKQKARTRPKKELNRVAAGGQKREKRTAHKMKIKESMDVGFF
jgi:hypothetical protein